MHAKPLPVSLANPLKLVGYETGEERAHTSIANKGLGHASQPNINVVWRAVKLYKPAGQSTVVQDLCQLPFVSGLREPT